jgi:hypothetical protein
MPLPGCAALKQPAAPFRAIQCPRSCGLSDHPGELRARTAPRSSRFSACKEIVKAHGGTITANSAGNAGTTFAVLLNSRAG